SPRDGDVKLSVARKALDRFADAPADAPELARALGAAGEEDVRGSGGEAGFAELHEVALDRIAVGAVDLEEEARFGRGDLGREVGPEALLHGFENSAREKLASAQNDSDMKNARHGAGDDIEGRERSHERPAIFRERDELERDLGHDRERAFAADEEA